MKKDFIDLEKFNNYCLNKKTYSQLNQDLFVSYMTENKRGGYFVEFGATDGLELNNTYSLEKEYGWDGILCEPNFIYHKNLIKNRSCHIDTRCVYTSTGSIINFLFCSDHPMASTINYYRNCDEHANIRYGTEYPITTVSLNDLLDHYSAPEVIDYMSIDTEGSELDILLSFNFSRQINLVTIEHNNTPNRDLIKQLMEANNFVRVFEQIAKWDDWYINRSFLD
jgi:hypothetical protein